MRVIGITVQRNGIGRIGKPLDHVSGFEIILAVSVRCEPPWRTVSTKWIVKRFGQLVTERSDVRKSGSEQARCNPGGVVQHVTAFLETVGFVSRFHIIRVKAQNAAVIRIAILIQVSVRENEASDVLG